MLRGHAPLWQLPYRIKIMYEPDDARHYNSNSFSSAADRILVDRRILSASIRIKGQFMCRVTVSRSGSLLSLPVK